MSSDNHVHNCDNQVGAGGTQGGNFVHSTLHNPVFHIHSPPGRILLDESSLTTTEPRRRPSDAEEELLRPYEKRKKSDEEIGVENQEEIQDTQNKASLCIRQRKRIRIIILILLPQILIIIITIIVIIINKSGN